MRRDYIEDNVWQTQEAKAEFCHLKRMAMVGYPQIVTHNGEPAVMVIKYDVALDKKLRKKKKLTVRDIFYDPIASQIPLDLTREKRKKRREIKW